MLSNKTIAMYRDEIFTKLWKFYTHENPSIEKVHKSFTDVGEVVTNDHIALRTFNNKKVNISVLEKPFINAGYIEKGSYYFAEKKINAKHYEIPNDSNAPKVFISELILEEFSNFLQNTVIELLNSVDEEKYNSIDLIYMGNLWGTPLYPTYEKLRKESEYAAWLYVYGFRANHFTVNINNLKKLNTIEKVNKHLKENGFKLNNSGGEIKGTKEDLLQQSSIMAEHIPVKFQGGIFKIPGCYYEFAYRYPDKNGKLFNGFLAKSADKIFESTNFR